MALISDGFPLVVSSNECFPLDLSFTASNANFTISPLMLQVDVPYFDQSLTTNQNLLMQVATRSDLPLTYQWQHEDQDLEGQTNSVLFFGPVTAPQAGKYRLVMTTSNGIEANSWFGPEVRVTIPASLILSLTTGYASTNSTVELSISGEPGETFLLESSADLVSWETISTNEVSEGGSSSIYIPVAGTPSAKFLRAEIPTTVTF